MFAAVGGHHEEMDGGPLSLDAWPGLELRERLDGGARNSPYLARRGDRRFVVRRSRREESSLAWELDLLVSLHDAGFVVPRPVPSFDGRLCVDGTVVTALLTGRPASERRDWQKVVKVLVDLHRFTVGYPQRPGFASSGELLRLSSGGDVDLSMMAGDDALAIRAAWRRVQVGPVSVVHGDPGALNVVVADDGSVGLLDWDEARVDVGWFDIAALPEDIPLPLALPVVRGAVISAGVAWEAATSWEAEPDYARRRLAELNSRNSTPENGKT